MRALSTLAARVVDTLELTARNDQLSRYISEREQSRAALEQANERLTAFAGQISHDLKSPLTGLVMALDLIEENLGTEPGALLTRLVTRARGSSARMTELIDAVLRFATLTERPDFTSVSLNEVVDDVRDDLFDALAAAQVEVGELPAVHGDRQQLRAVVQNLIGNAVKYADPGRPPVVTIAATTTESMARIEVADNGRGIAPEHVDAVFEPLVRADDVTTGHGIGLATCRRVIESHGGRIGLTSTEGVGTTVWFELPLA